MVTQPPFAPIIISQLITILYAKTQLDFATTTQRYHRPLSPVPSLSGSHQTARQQKDTSRVSTTTADGEVQDSQSQFGYCRNQKDSPESDSPTKEHLWVQQIKNRCVQTVLGTGGHPQKRIDYPFPKLS